MHILTEPCYIRSVHQARCDLCDWSGDLTGDEDEASRQAGIHRRHPLHIRKAHIRTLSAAVDAR